MLTEPINTRLAELGQKIRQFDRDRQHITFSFNGERYTTRERGRYKTFRELEHAFGNILSDLINTIDLPGDQVCHGDGIRFKIEEQCSISISVYDKDQATPARDKKQDFLRALISYYARKCGIDFEDDNVHDIVKLCVRDEIGGYLSSVTLFHRFVGSTCTGSGNMYTDLRATLFDEPEFEQFREFKDAPGVGLIEKFFNGLHSKFNTNPAKETLVQREASVTHLNLIGIGS